MFEPARLKIKWADKHIEDFNKTVETFVQTDFYAMVIELDPNTGSNVLKFKMIIAPPWELAMILGDAVHNLRAALDLAYVELVSRVGKVPTKWTSFRIWETKEKLVDALGKGILQGADDVIAMLSDAVRGYDGGDPLLTALDALDIDDKHRTIIPVFSVVRVDHVDAITSIGATKITIQNCTFAVGQDGVINLASMPGAAGQVEMKSKGQPAYAVLFGEGTSLKGQPIVPSLTQFGQLVGGVIDVFDATILARAHV